MSIVSAKLGISKIAPKRSRVSKVSQLGYDEVPETESVPQKAVFTQSHRDRKTGMFGPPTPATCSPLYSLQEGSDAPKPLFETYDGPVLPAAPPKEGKTITQLLNLEDSIVTTTQFNYNAGIKPGPRAIKFSDMALASGDMFRS